MDFTRMKKAFAGLSVAAIMLTQAGSVFAAYSDVPNGVWYEEAVEAFMDAGYLDAAQTRFRGNDPANRAEFVKLVVVLNGGILSTPPAVPSFDDVATGAWYYGYFEEAGKEGWVKGDKDCYGSHPCYARPSANINRAEAAALIVRSFNLEATGDAAQFVDNPSGQWYTDVIQTAADYCVLQGDGDTGRVRPGDNMNRAEMVVMLHRVDQGLTYGVDCGTEEQGEAMISNVVATSATTVEVSFNVTIKEDSAKDSANYTVTGSPAVPVSSVKVLNKETVELTMSQSLTASHEYTLTVQNVEAADGTIIDDAMTFLGYTSLVMGDGVLEVSAAASNPVGDTVPQGAVGVVLLSVDLTASCDDSITMENFTVLHEGFGAETDIDGVYGAINGARVTRKRTIDAQDQTADLRFSSPLVLDPCETVTLDVVADFSSTATTAAEHNLVVELPSDIFGNAKEVKGNFPVRGNTFRLAAVTSGTVTVTYRTVSPDQIEVGDLAAVIGKWEVAINSTEDQTFYSMTLEQNGSTSDGDFTNIAIRRTDGTVLTNTVTQTVGDFVTLVFDPPFTVLEGDKVTLEVVADISGGAAKTIIMHFEESSDLFAVGSLYGYGVNGQLYGSQVSLPTETTSLPDTVNIDAGEFTIGVNGPATKDYTRDAKDAILANVEFKTGGEDIDVKTMYIAIQGVSSTGGLLCGGGDSDAATASCGTGTDDAISEMMEGVELRNTTTGRTVSAVRLTTTGTFGHQVSGADIGTFQIYRFDDFVVKGTESWQLRADFIDNGAAMHPESGDKFRVHICTQPTDILVSGVLTANSTGCSFSNMITSSTAYQMQVEGLSTGDKVGDVRPLGNIAGNYQRVTSATLTIAVKSIGVTDTAVSNAKNVKLLRFEARAGEAEDILFTKSVFMSASGSLLNASNYTLWVDTNADGNVDTALESGVASQSSSITFSQLAGGGYVIPAEQTVVFEVHGDIASSLTDYDIQLRFGTGTITTVSLADGPTFIEAEQLADGSNLSGVKLNGSYYAGVTSADITVTTVTSQLWVLTGQGDLFVSSDTTPVRSRQLLGGTLGEAVMRMRMRAQNEPIDVTDIHVTASGSSGVSIDSVELYKDGESQSFALATIGGCGTKDVPFANINSWQNTTIKTFCAPMQNRQLVIQPGQDIVVLARPRLKTDVDGGTSNELVYLFIDHFPVSDEATGSGAIHARGDMSSNNLAKNDEDSSAEGEVFIGTDTVAANAAMAGSKNRVVLSKITSIVNASTDANGSAIPIGQSDIAKFKFSAAANVNSKNGLNKAVLSGIVFSVNATNVAITDGTFKVYNEADSTNTTACVAYATTGARQQVGDTASGSVNVDCKGLASGTLNTQINSGGDLVLVLQAEVTDTNTSAVGAPSTLQVTLQDFDGPARTRYGHLFTTTGSHLQWNDKDTSTTTFSWIEYPTTTVKSTSYSG